MAINSSEFGDFSSGSLRIYKSLHAMMLNMNGTHAHFDNDNYGLLERHPRLAGLWASKTTKEQQEDRDRKTGRSRTEKEGAEGEREYIEHRLRELAAWERKISGNKN